MSTTVSVDTTTHVTETGTGYGSIPTSTSGPNRLLVLAIGPDSGTIPIVSSIQTLNGGTVVPGIAWYRLGGSTDSSFYGEVELWAAPAVSAISGYTTQVSYSTSPIASVVMLDAFYLTAGATIVPAVSVSATFNDGNPTTNANPVVSLVTSQANDHVISYCWSDSSVAFVAETGYILTGADSASGYTPVLAGEIGTSSTPTAGTAVSPGFSPLSTDWIIGAFALNSSATTITRRRFFSRSNVF